MVDNHFPDGCNQCSSDVYCNECVQLIKMFLDRVQEYERYVGHNSLMEMIIRGMPIKRVH